MARWISTNWTLEELQGKTVEFSWNRTNATLNGLGRFVVTKNGQRLLILIQPLSRSLDPKLHLVVGEPAAISRKDSTEAEFACTLS